MAYRREYYPSDTIKLINESEGNLVRNRTRSTPAEVGEIAAHGAHAMSQHLVKGAPGSLGHGVASDTARDRFVNNPTYDDGSPRFNSIWLGKGDMSILLCETLNSPIAQEALGALDRGVHRVAIHYLNLGKLAGLFSGLGKVGVKVSEVAVTPEHYITEQKSFFNPKQNITITKDIRRRIPVSRVANLRLEDIAAVHTVLDAFGDGLHVQTLYASHEAVPDNAGWRIGAVNIKVVIGSDDVPIYQTLPAH